MYVSKIRIIELHDYIVSIINWSFWAGIGMVVVEAEVSRASYTNMYKLGWNKTGFSYAVHEANPDCVR